MVLLLSPLFIKFVLAEKFLASNSANFKTRQSYVGNKLKNELHMNNFNWESFTKKISIKSNISDLYNAWSIPQEIEKWFLSEAVFEKPDGQLVKRNENFKENDSYQWSWYLFDTIENGKVIKANNKDFIQFTFAGECIVEIKLTQNLDEVIVELTQSNIPTDDNSKRGIRIGCDSGWSFFLVNLKSILEGGIDLRNKNANLKGMLNN